MPIGALIGTAVVGAGASVISSGNTASAQNRATDAATGAANQNNALQRDIYGKNSANLSPFMQRGNAAGDAYNALLGLPTAQAAPTPQYGGAAPYGASAGGFGAYNGGQDFAYGGYGADPNAGYRQPADQAGFAPPQQQPSTTHADATGAFNNFLNSDGYQFRLGQGLNATNAGYAARGLLQSGAALKALSDYGQNTGSAEFGKYLGYLGNQQQTGLSGANALAGVGTNYANAVSANNDSAATTTANAALAGAGQQNALLGGFATQAGNLAGQFAGLGSSYGRGFTPPASGGGYTAADYGF